MCDCQKRRKKSAHLIVTRDRALKLSKLEKKDVIIYKMRLEPTGFIYNFAVSSPETSEINKNDIIEIIRWQQEKE